mgnify:CR=1 FL=1
MNSDAEVVLGDAGNPNDVQLTWERTSTGFYDTLEDKAVVFTYGIDATKTFSDNAGNFDNVEFTLYLICLHHSVSFHPSLQLLTECPESLF